MISGKSPTTPDPIAEALEKLIAMASDNAQPSFRDLVKAAGLDPERDFVGASLRDLDFRNEDLRGFDFSDADLTGADFRRAKIAGVSFFDADLTGAIGLIGARFRDIDVAPEMVVVPSGAFLMGSRDGEGDDDERPRHEVSIVRPLAVGRFAVTFEEWDAAYGRGGVKHNPGDEGWGRGRRPVINVSWEDAQAYVGWLSRETGKTYRLLSEAQWEYCCRAGTTTEYSYGDEIDKSQAQFSARRSVETGSFPANAWGLHEMHGNVWEWCQDNWHDDYEGNPPSDGSVWPGGMRLFAFCAAGPGTTVRNISGRRSASGTFSATASTLSASELPERFNLLCLIPLTS
jgi:formylglycine-generating enzyme required for sulfatase activity